MTRKIYLDYLRIIAAFTVVYFHVLAIYHKQNPKNKLLYLELKN